jgi:hypothetical protein
MDSSDDEQSFSEIVIVRMLWNLPYVEDLSCGISSFVMSKCTFF